MIAGVKDMQIRLAAAGFDPGPLDGQVGDRTLAALDAALAAARTRGPMDDNDAILAAELERDEGFVPYGYVDSEGYLTLGIGRMIDKRRNGGITREEALYLKRNDIARVNAELDRLAPWWRDLDPVRRRVVQNMTFNMGSGWIAKFANTVAAIRRGDWRAAARGMRLSQWASQVGGRAERLARMMESGRA